MTEQKGEPVAKCPYCDQTWPMDTDQKEIDRHMKEVHPGEPWHARPSFPPKPPGVH